MPTDPPTSASDGQQDRISNSAARDSRWRWWLWRAKKRLVVWAYMLGLRECEHADHGTWCPYSLAEELKEVIHERAATWETEFDAGPGDVVGVPDAASVTAHWLVERGFRRA